MADPTIAAGYPRAFLDFAVSRGCDRAHLLKASGLTAAALDDPDGRVPLNTYVGLMEAAIAQLDEPALALEFGKAVRMQDISIVGLICEAAETTAEVGRQLNRYGRLVIDDGSDTGLVRGTPDKEGVWMEAIGPAWFEHPLIVEAELARLVWNTRIMFANDPTFRAMRFPLAVHFMQREPNNRSDYERIFGAPLVFGSTRNALLLDFRFGQLRQPPTNRYVFGVLSEKAEALLKKLRSEDTTRARVESLVIPALHTGDISMDWVADRMALSRRTLQRRLGDEGTSFEKLLDQLRHRLALDYLAGRKVSVNETAYLLGFSDPAAFSRAFKRWTGESPRARLGRKPAAQP